MIIFKDNWMLIDIISMVFELYEMHEHGLSPSGHQSHVCSGYPSAHLFTPNVANF